MILHLPDILKTRLIQYAKNKPYAHIGDYMERYWIVPYADPQAGDGCGLVSKWRRPFARTLQEIAIAIRVHCIKRSDSDRAVHDHPWWFLTIILFGRYIEVRPMYDRSGMYLGMQHTEYGPGSVLFRRAGDLHRLVLPNNGGHVWTLFITGPKQQRWGFVKNEKLDRKTYYRAYFKEQGL